jgi:hypothetical protein
MQYAVTQAIASAFSPKYRPAFWSYLFQTIAPEPESTRHHATGQPFPHDVHFLSAADLDNIIKIAENHQHDAWPPERIAAYQHDDILPKRAAVSAFLWARYTESPRMTGDLLERWHRIEQLDELLNVPNWFRQQHLDDPDQVTARWKAKLGGRYADYVQAHQDTLAEIQALLAHV